MPIKRFPLFVRRFKGNIKETRVQPVKNMYVNFTIVKFNDTHKARGESALHN